MKYSLRSKLSFSYILVVLISVTLLTILSNVFLERQFREYVRQNQEQNNKEIVTSVGQQFSGDGTWDMDGLETIGVSALENGMIIKVKDVKGSIIWNAREHNNGMCQRIIEHMSQNMSSRYPHVKGTYEEKPYAVSSNFNKVGTVEIGTYGPFYLSDNDLAFINTLNMLLIGVGIFSIIFALVLGSIMANRLSSPISRVIRASQMISKGYYSDRISEKSNTREINQLTSTINDLADTLEKQETLRKRLTADVAHELRTPLATLQSHMEAMIDGIWKPDNERLQSCHEEIVRISKMVGDLEKLAKYESENLVLNKTEFDATELIRHIIQNFESQYRAKGLEIGLEGDSVAVYADKDKISQVMVNLLSNALKYTAKGGFVTVNLKMAEDSTEISIKDTGTGIPEEDLPYIFERFYRADKSRNRLTGGSGIGLSITKAIVEAHRGKIEVHSMINEGTELVISLPRREM